MRIIIFAMFVLNLYSSSVSSTLISYLHYNHVQSVDIYAEFLMDSDLISLYKYHFVSTRILSIIIQPSSHDNWIYFINEFIHKMKDYLHIPMLITKMNYSADAEDSVYTETDEPFPLYNSKRLPNYINDYPAESQHSYILVAEDANYLYNYVKQGRQNLQQKDWNPKDNFLIINLLMSELSCIQSIHSYNVAKELWENSGIINAITYIKSFYKCDGFKDRIFMYNPFHTNKSNDLIEREVVPINLKHLSHIPKTYLKRTWNLGSCDIKVSLFNIFPTAVRVCGICNSTLKSIEIHSHVNFKMDNNCVCTFKGRDWEVLKNLAIYMNFTPTIVSEHESIDASEAIIHLENKQSEISFNERYLKDYNNSLIEFTMPAFYTRKIVVIVAKAQNIPIWTVVWQYFSGYFWIYFITTFIASTILWYRLRRNLDHVSKFSNAMDMFAVFMTMSLNVITRVVCSSQRVLLTSCLVSSLIIMSYFQSSLLDVVSYPHFYPEINTLSHLDKANIPIITSDSSLLDTFDESPSMINLAHKTKYMRNISMDTMIKEIIIFRNASLLTSMVEAIWYLGKYPNELHIVEEYPREYFVSYLIPKGSPYATRIHNLLGKMTSAGLVRKWDLDTSHSLNLEAFGSRICIETNLSHNSITVFCLYNLVFSFVVFGAGMSIGVLVFCIEFFTYCLQIKTYIRNKNAWHSDQV
ncbi:hypothetical protein L9F63_010373 [Diploptera punctata]|uniref:Ionotropic receptor n=1 Tax=Diploptera punctata TaxID=6984 RepID=A0AAD8AH87_DIPPU|nr:hypothetical protein L9F63_010373 [Diploptera punctata]